MPWWYVFLKTKAHQMIEIDYLHTHKGHAKVIIDDDDPAKRADLAQTIIGLLKNGHAVFVEQEGETFAIRGYDAVDNTWIVRSSTDSLPGTAEPRGKKKRERQSKVLASGSKVTPVPAKTGS